MINIYKNTSFGPKNLFGSLKKRFLLPLLCSLVGSLWSEPMRNQPKRHRRTQPSALSARYMRSYMPHKKDSLSWIGGGAIFAILLCVGLIATARIAGKQLIVGAAEGLDENKGKIGTQLGSLGKTVVDTTIGHLKTNRPVLVNGVVQGTHAGLDEISTRNWFLKLLLGDRRK